MIVILNTSYLDAQHHYDYFLWYLETFYPESIKRRYDEECCVELTDDLRYIFINRRYSKLFSKYRPDFVESSDFLSKLDLYPY